MKVKDIFEIGVIMEDEEKTKSIKILDADDCKITGKTLNRNKIILHMKRESDGSEGNVFVRLNDANEKNFPVSKKLLGSKKVLGLSLNELKNYEIDSL